MYSDIWDDRAVFGHLKSKALEALLGFWGGGRTGHGWEFGRIYDIRGICHMDSNRTGREVMDDFSLSR